MPCETKCVQCERNDVFIVKLGMCRGCLAKPSEAKPAALQLKRNARCFCGSGLKFKKCCLILVKHHANIRESGGTLPG